MPLSLPQSERAAVFRTLVQILRNDPILANIVKTWLAWTGGPNDAADLGVNLAPAIRLTPVGAGDKWLAPDSMIGPLFLDLEILVAGHNTDDLDNLWRAVIAAIYAPTQTTFAANQALLRAAGAFPPSPMFTVPAFDPQPDITYLHSHSQIRVMVQTQLGSRGVSNT